MADRNSFASRRVVGTAALLIGASALGGCASSTVSDDFFCDAQIGTPCATIAAADGQGSAAHGLGGGVRTGGGQHERPSPGFRNANLRSGPQPIPFEDPPHVAGVPQTVTAGGDLYGTEVVNPVLFREPERVTTVWIAPFVGQNGYLYQPGFVHFVVEPGRWFGPGAAVAGTEG